MKKILSRQQMRVAESYTMLKDKLSEQDLIEKAASAMAEVFDKYAPSGNIAVVCGGGNNGADGYCLANLLKKQNRNVICINVATKLNDKAKHFYKKFDGKKSTFLEDIKDAEIIIDAILGIGISKNLSGNYLQAVEKINSLKAYKISIDIPTGIDADSGLVLKNAVKSHLTFALSSYKLGHFLNDGIDYYKKIVLLDGKVDLDDASYLTLVDENYIKGFFPKRKRNVNKGDFGRCSLISGSYEYSGAAMICANSLASLKMGSGYANLCIPQSLFNTFSGKAQELTITLLKDKVGRLEFDREMLKKISTISTSIVIGMGLQVSESVYKSIEYLLKNFKGKLIIDADGLNSLAKYGVEILKDKKCEVLLTPHIKEFSRLTKKPVAQILKDSLNITKEFAKTYDVCVLLKSAVSVISSRNSQALNIRGTSAMAKAGSGDILSGVIGGIAARDINLFDCASIGSYICGAAGEIAAKNSSDYTVIATDIISNLEKAFIEIIN